MGYNCVVLVKQVPDTKRITGDAMKEDGTVNRAALPGIFNPEDLHALEMALGVRDRCGGTVTAVVMGPPAACEVLRDCLGRGADRAILVTDRKAAASDTLATSYILSCAVRKLGDVDLVFCGRQAIDGDTAQVGPQLAEKLDLPQITYAESVEAVADGTITVRRNVGNGYEVVRAALPVLLTATDTAAAARPPAVRKVMKSKKARARVELAAAIAEAMPDADEAARAAEVDRRAADLAGRGLLIDQWSLADIDADLAWCGRDGSPTKVHRIQAVVLTGKGHKTVEPTDEGLAALVGELIEDHTIG
ncbi:MAG: electron transfer flavoprotein subunit beta/FixA family protein [Planctomycetes bacterium]|nr:electron transfer flavoprotein subunit beta/FixA family protein [Planctomycetota bacterium]